jgi:hypothetical protein
MVAAVTRNAWNGSPTCDAFRRIDRSREIERLRQSLTEARTQCLICFLARAPLPGWRLNFAWAWGRELSACAPANFSGPWISLSTTARPYASYSLFSIGPFPTSAPSTVARGNEARRALMRASGSTTSTVWRTVLSDFSLKSPIDLPSGQAPRFYRAA